jgi:hypothetical protein
MKAAAPSRGAAALSGPHPVELQQGIITSRVLPAYKPKEFVPTRRSEERGGPSPRVKTEGEQYTTCILCGPPQFFPRGWARGNGLKGAILKWNFRTRC